MVRCRSLLDPESREWVRSLRGTGREHDEAVARLHALLLRARPLRDRPPPAARCRTCAADDLDDIARQAADDALVAILRRLDDFRGASRFTTWAYKFALLEAAVKLRRRAWQGREVPLEPETWSLFSSAGPRPRGSRRSRASWSPTLQHGDRRGADAAPAATCSSHWR